MKIGIVGSSKADHKYYNRVLEVMNDLKVEFNDVTFVTGGAVGVDSIVESVCRTNGIPCIVHQPETYNWKGFKARNIKIAEDSDLVVSIVLKGAGCYHCGFASDHKKTAGCWTRNHAKELGKQVRTVII